MARTFVRHYRIIVPVILILVVIIPVVSGVSTDLTTRTCSIVFGASCANTEKNSPDDNAIDAGGTCNGKIFLTRANVTEATINATTIRGRSTVNITCGYKLTPDVGETAYFYIWYYNASGGNDGTNWVRILRDTTTSSFEGNRSANVIVNNTDGEHIFRCNAATSLTIDPEENDFCASSSTTFDNDDVNFTVFVPNSHTNAHDF